MSFQPFKTSFSHLHSLGRHRLLWAEHATLDLFEYRPTGPTADIEIAGHTLSGSRPVGISAASRIWRVTFEHPLAMRVRDEGLYFAHPDRARFMTPYSYASDSVWLSELRAEALFRAENPLHFAFVLWDDLVELIADGFPTVEEIAQQEV